MAKFRDFPGLRADPFKTASGVQNSGPSDPGLPVAEKADFSHSARCAPLVHRQRHGRNASRCCTQPRSGPSSSRGHRRHPSAEDGEGGLPGPHQGLDLGICGWHVLCHLSHATSFVGDVAPRARRTRAMAIISGQTPAHLPRCTHPNRPYKPRKASTPPVFRRFFIFFLPQTKDELA